MMRHAALLLLSLSVPAAAKKKAAPPPDPFVEVKPPEPGWKRFLYSDMQAFIDVPPGFVRVPVKKNQDIAYQFAMKHESEKYELRYHFNALARQAKAQRADCEARAAKDGGSCLMADVDAPSENWISALTFNISEQEPPNMPYPERGVAKEFGADWGYNAVPVETHPRHDFGRGYGIAHVSLVHRKGVGQIACIALFDDIRLASTLGRGLIYTARFTGSEAPGFPASPAR